MKRIALLVFGIMFSMANMNCDALKSKDRNVTAKKQKWEYGTQFAIDGAVSSVFNNLGKEGWEAVWCRRANTGNSGEKTVWGYECLFKRPKQD